MGLGKYSVFFLLSMVKFLFTPFGGPAAGLTFFETYFSCVSGAFISANIFYFMSEYFMKKAHFKRVKLRQEAIEKGLIIPHKNKFTTMNKFVVRMKMRFGIFGIAMYAPLFLSVPIGTIVTAKFYGKERRTFPIIILGLFVNGLITCGVSYLIADFL
jgi:hypothetical protein